MKIQTAVLSDIGGRETNDDTVSVLEDKGTYVYVGDGLGGYAGGSQASRAASDVLMGLAAEGGLVDQDRMFQAAGAANQAVRDLQEQTRGTMMTTMVLLAIEDGKAMWAHVGDSRLYHFRDGKLVFQTMDHSVSQLAVLMGDITQEEIRFHVDRNRILRALGSGNANPAVSSEAEIVPGDSFLLCTDGFWEYVYEEDMEKTLSRAEDPQVWIDAMIRIHQSRVPENNDNYTAAAVFCR